jgi:PAS domain S-box-containing protein
MKRDEDAANRGGMFSQAAEVRGAPQASPPELAELADHGSDGLLAFDRELRCRYGNLAVRRLTGLRADNWVGRAAEEVFPFLDHAALRRTLEGDEDASRVTSSAASFLRPGSSERCFFEAQYLPLHGARGEIAGAGVVIRDVTSLRQAEQMLRETESRFPNQTDRHLESELRDAVQIRDQFLSVASHELGTPLTSLRLLVDMLLRTLKRQPANDPSSQLLESRVNAIGDQVLRLAGLVETMLDVSRIAQGRLSLSPEPVDLSALVRRVASRMSRVANDAGCSVALDIPGPVEGIWDRERVEQMVSNLLSNAFKYGAGKPVNVEVAANEATARLRVIDRGIGIAADRQTTIFERFGRAAPKNQYGGFGLGLWITRQTLQAMGGAILVQSEPGAGARFEIELPRSPSALGFTS